MIAIHVHLIGNDSSTIKILYFYELWKLFRLYTFIVELLPTVCGDLAGSVQADVDGEATGRGREIRSTGGEPDGKKYSRLLKDSSGYSSPGGGECM